MIAGRATAWAIRVIAQGRCAFEAALALLARRVDVSAFRGRLVALRALSGPQRLAGLSPACAGIARLRRSAALLGVSSFMIRVSIQGCPKRGLPTEGKNGLLTGRISGCGCCPRRRSFGDALPTYCVLCIRWQRLCR